MSKSNRKVGNSQKVEKNTEHLTKLIEALVELAKEVHQIFLGALALFALIFHQPSLISEVLKYFITNK